MLPVLKRHTTPNLFLIQSSNSFLTSVYFSVFLSVKHQEKAFDTNDFNVETYLNHKTDPGHTDSQVPSAVITASQI